jgi:hypothetical protein
MWWARWSLLQARVECQNHRLTIEDAPTPEYMASTIGGIQQK